MKTPMASDGESLKKVVRPSESHWSFLARQKFQCALWRAGVGLSACQGVLASVALVILGSCAAQVGRWISEEEWANLSRIPPSADRVIASLGSPGVIEQRDDGGITLRYSYVLVRNRPGRQEWVVQLAWFSFDDHGSLLDSGKEVLALE